MIICQTVRELRLSLALTKDQSLGFVPTMGNLHEGHESLVKRSLVENNKTVVSLFINPTQFDKKSDLESYPKTYKQDLARLEKLKVDYVFCPQREEIYHDNYVYKVSESNLSLEREGASRAGHFDGVLTVVLKLLNLVEPNRLYLGEKDYQQLELIKGMIEAFFLKIEVVPCETVRNKKGLALSSRNSRLSSEEQEKASVFSKLLKSENSASFVSEKLEQEGFKVDYVEDKLGRRYGAVWLGSVRLIDNTSLGRSC